MTFFVASSAFFSFFQISGDDWEIKQVLRTMAPSVEVGFNLVCFCRAFVKLLEIVPSFHLVLELLARAY